MSWRPKEGWNKLRGLAISKSHGLTRWEIFELGADAMLAELEKRGLSIDIDGRLYLQSQAPKFSEDIVKEAMLERADIERRKLNPAD